MAVLMLFKCLTTVDADFFTCHNFLLRQEVESYPTMVFGLLGNWLRCLRLAMTAGERTVLSLGDIRYLQRVEVIQRLDVLKDGFDGLV